MTLSTGTEHQGCAKKHGFQFLKENKEEWKVAPFPVGALRPIHCQKEASLKIKPLLSAITSFRLLLKG